MLNTNKTDWDRPDTISGPTLNITKFGGAAAGVITAVGGALTAWLKTVNAAQPVVIGMLGVIAVTILAFALIAAVDIMARARVAAAAPFGSASLSSALVAAVASGRQLDVVLTGGNKAALSGQLRYDDNEQLQIQLDSGDWISPDLVRAFTAP
jgi:hypothetical protein